MISLRRSQDRGHANRGWLDSRFSFSFSDYYDPDHTGFSSLRVINEDRVSPGAGFPPHPHRDMEILTYVLRGTVEHRDSIGNRAVIRPGDVQRMSAGTGITHSEFNPSESEAEHYLQIWIQPDRRGIEPGYEQKHFDEEEKRGRLRLIAAPAGSDADALALHQDARVYASMLESGQRVTHESAPDRKIYVHVIYGQVEVNGTPLFGGDAAKIVDEQQVQLIAHARSELLLFDLA